MSNSDLPNNNNDNNNNKPKRGRPKKVEENNTYVDPPKDVIAVIKPVEQTLNETIHEIMYSEIPRNDDEAKLTDTLLDIILNEPALKLNIISKIDNSNKPKRYTEAHRLAQARYRAKYPEKYKELQKKVFEKIKADEERKPKYDKMNRESHKRINDRKREEKLARGETVRPRGRPKKVKTDEILKTGEDI